MMVRSFRALATILWIALTVRFTKLSPLQRLLISSTSSLTKDRRKIATFHFHNDVAGADVTPREGSVTGHCVALIR